MNFDPNTLIFTSNMILDIFIEGKTEIFINKYLWYPKTDYEVFITDEFN